MVGRLFTLVTAVGKGKDILLSTCGWQKVAQEGLVVGQLVAHNRED